jgi:hypothetical protein
MYSSYSFLFLFRRHTLCTSSRVNYYMSRPSVLAIISCMHLFPTFKETFRIVQILA